MSMIRSKWAAVGAAVAVTLGAGGISLTQAAISSDPKPVYIALDAPCRVIDTRSTNPIGAGETNTLTVQITGPNGDCTDNLTVPAAAIAVATNVTAIQPNGAASGRSFFTVYPANATLPTTSNLNFVNGQPPAPNKVDVGLSTDGKIKIYNNQGTAHAAVDIFGYYIDHHHDDHYYTKTQTDIALGTKANAADVYTKEEFDTSTANSIKAVGRVDNGIVLTSYAGFGNFTATRSGPGLYAVRLPGLRPGCANSWPTIILTGDLNTVVSANGASTNCSTGDVALSVSVRNSAGTLVNGIFNFMLFHQPGDPLGAFSTEATFGYTSCTISPTSSKEVCS